MTTAVAPAPAPPTTATPPAPPSPDAARLYRLSVEQYERMIDQGVLTKRDKVELIEGYLVEKMSKNTPHLSTALKLDRTFLRILTDGWLSLPEWPVLLARSEPEPDVMIVRGGSDDYTGRKPTAADVAVLVEVADSSLADDRARRPLFAEAGVPVYWIVNIPERKIEVYTDPAGGEYRSRQDFADDADVPLVVDGQPIARLKVRDLLPPAEAS